MTVQTDYPSLLSIHRPIHIPITVAVVHTSSNTRPTNGLTLCFTYRKEYFGAVEGFTKPEVITDVTGAPDVSLLGKLQNFLKRTQGDPFYAVVAHRNFKPVRE